VQRRRKILAEITLVSLLQLDVDQYIADFKGNNNLISMASGAMNRTFGAGFENNSGYKSKG
jgi:hypothetical protein